jgi:hypothetical protein
MGFWRSGPGGSGVGKAGHRVRRGSRRPLHTRARRCAGDTMLAVHFCIVMRRIRHFRFHKCIAKFEQEALSGGRNGHNSKSAASLCDLA